MNGEEFEMFKLKDKKKLPQRQTQWINRDTHVTWMSRRCFTKLNIIAHDSRTVCHFPALWRTSSCSVNVSLGAIKPEPNLVLDKNSHLPSYFLKKNIFLERLRRKLKITFGCGSVRHKKDIFCLKFLAKMWWMWTKKKNCRTQVIWYLTKVFRTDLFKDLRNRKNISYRPAMWGLFKD